MTDNGKRLSAAQRDALVRDLKKTGLRQSELAEKYGIDVRTVRRYAKRCLTPKRLAQRTAVNLPTKYRSAEQWAVGKKYWKNKNRRQQLAIKAARTRRQESDAKLFGADGDVPM